MKAGSGLASASQPFPELAGEAVRQAMDHAGTTQPTQILLLLSREYARQPQAALREASRAAASLQIAGGTVQGVFTERGWVIDQPAAAALVIAQAGSSNPPVTSPLELCFSSQALVSPAATPRAGIMDGDGAAWQQARVMPNGWSTQHLPGTPHPVLSRGLRPIGAPFPLEVVDGHELRITGCVSARDYLLRVLPAELRDRPPVHQLRLCTQPESPGIALLSINADGSLTLAEPVAAGATGQWMLRQPLASASEMQSLFAAEQARRDQISFAVMCSCIGRGPFFYGDEDLDLQAFRSHFSGVPLIGGYGTGQWIPTPNGQRCEHNAVLTLLYENAHV